MLAPPGRTLLLSPVRRSIRDTAPPWQAEYTMLGLPGSMRDWKLLTPSEYGGASALPEGSLVLQIRTTKEAFAVVLSRMKSGDYRATQLAR